MCEIYAQRALQRMLKTKKDTERFTTTTKSLDIFNDSELMVCVLLLVVVSIRESVEVVVVKQGVVSIAPRKLLQKISQRRENNEHANNQQRSEHKTTLARFRR